MPKVVMFCHSLRSDWNHGNAHFLRGVLSECWHRGFDVVALERVNSWSARNLLQDHGSAALDAWRDAYPPLPLLVYDPAWLDLDRLLHDADLVLVHEWNDPELVARVARHRKYSGSYLLFFHDTHHRIVSAPEAIGKLELDGFDAVLAFGAALREAYARHGWGRQAFTWHEAADLRVFVPRPDVAQQRDLVWIGNWGDDERTAEIHEFLVEPVALLRLSARTHGVRYPLAAKQILAYAGIEFAGYLPNFCVPEAFAAARATVHIPRRPYAQMLPGVPTIRVFETLACGIPLVSAPWEDTEGLFQPDTDFLLARSGAEMVHHLDALTRDSGLADALAQHGRATIEARHSCAHRLDELLAICRMLGRELSVPQNVAVQ
jgi:spore maturation protein CgeB